MQSDAGREQALLVMKCAGCQLANEVSIPVGEQRVFAVQCCGCNALNEITIDTNGGPLVCNEGKAEWNKHIRESQAEASASAEADEKEVPAPPEREEPATAVPPKKRQKSGVAPRAEKEDTAKKEVKAEKAEKVEKAEKKGAKPQPKAAVKPEPPQEAPAGPKPGMPLVEVPRPVAVKLGSAVIAKFNDGYYYHGVVEEMQASIGYRWHCAGLPL